MTNKVAVILFALILVLLALDFWQGWGATMFLLRKAFELIDWMMFWR